MSSQTDHYTLLQVSITSTEVEIRAAYRRLARENHPDTNSSPEAEGLMRRINEAWETLRDSGRRAAYDRQLPRPARPAARPVRRQPPPPRRPAAEAEARTFTEDAPRAAARPGAEFTGDATINWYEKLGVREDAPRQLILKVLSRMAGELGSADISATEFTRKRETMREAWAILGDQYMRAAYDRARNQARAAEANRTSEESKRPAPPPPGYRVGPVTINGLTVDMGADLRGADLRGADLRGLDLARVDLRDAKLQGADLEAASLRGAKLSGADLSGANLHYADLSSADVKEAVLAQADLAAAALHATNLYRANLAGASLVDAVGPGINLDYADLRRADLTGAKITEQLIRRARLEGTVMPDGSVAQSS